MVLASIGLQLPKDGNPALSFSYSNILPQDTANVNEVKPQTDSEMKKEQENTKKARKEAGLPDINENALDAALFLKEKQDGFIENAFGGITKDKRNYKIALCWGITA